MANRKLSTLSLDEEVKSALAMMSLKTIKDVVTLPPYTLMDVLGQSAAQYKEFMDTLINLCLPPKTTAYEMEQREQQNTIPLGHHDLDILLCGGVLPGSLTEFVGPPGVGKTQWCLHMSASVVATGEGEGGTSPAVIYIDTECAARPERLVQMMKSKHPEQSAEIPKMLSRIHVFRPKTTSEMLEILDSLEFTVVEKDARLIVVDSMTSIEDGLSASSRKQRTQQLSSWAAKLKALAHHLNICVVVTNQITTMSDPNLPEPDLMEEYEGPGQHVPDPESPAPEARDDPVPDLENRVPYQGHNTNPNNCIPDSTTGPENRVSDQGHVTINEDTDDTLVCPEESVDSAKPSKSWTTEEMVDHVPCRKRHMLDSRAYTPLTKNSMPDQGHVPAPEDPMQMSDEEESDGLDEVSKPLIPAMGNTWTHCVNTRIVLQYTDSGRQLVIAKSPVSPYAALTYYIRENGIAVDERDGFYTYSSGVDPGLFRMRACPEEVAFGSILKQ